MLSWLRRRRERARDGFEPEVSLVMSLYEVSDVVVGESFLARDLVPMLWSEQWRAIGLQEPIQAQAEAVGRDELLRRRAG